MTDHIVPRATVRALVAAYQDAADTIRTAFAMLSAAEELDMWSDVDARLGAGCGPPRGPRT